MRKTGTLLLAAACAVVLGACGGTVENKPANAANTAKPAPAAPTADMLLEMEKKANEAYTKADVAYFQTLLSDKAVMSMGKDRMDKAAIIKMIGSAKCESVEVKLSDPQMSKIDNDTYAFSYKNESTGKCNESPNGAMVEVKPMREATIWVRNGDKWQAVWHASTLIVDPKGAAPTADNKDDKSADAKKEVPKKLEGPAEAKKEEPKKEDSAVDLKKEEAKKDDKAAPADAKSAAPQASANTDALAKAHAAGWEAFRTKDAKFFETTMAPTFAFVDPVGGWHSGKAEAIKIWTETMKCEGVTKTSFTDTFASAISPTVEILFGKGTADGSCDGQKNGDLWQTAAYVKEGDAWKLAFMFETPGKPAGK
ncbi:MAG: nuclear transport factor 2 family protein [Chloracidobacterium sp.]|nr:nuclear transport factor 2 family protein [Chloracidobacterium sp.]